MSGYDFVAIQEADAGSLRTGRINLIEFLAEHAGYAYCGLTVTRNFAPFARLALGYLSRMPPTRVVTHNLPGRLPGRSALEVDVHCEALGATTILVTHLALGSESRARQLRHLAGVMPRRRAIVVGDLNASPESVRGVRGLHESGMRTVNGSPATYPSWRPRRSLDQVLLTPDLRVTRAEALPATLSDHLPLAVDITAA